MGSWVHVIKTQLEDAEREGLLRQEQTARLEHLRAKERLDADAYWREVAEVEIDKKLALWEHAVNNMEQIQHTGSSAAQPTLDWLRDHTALFTREQRDRLMRLTHHLD